MAAALPFIVPILSTAVAIDQAKKAEHQAKVQADLQVKQIEETTRIEQEKIAQAERLAQQQLATQRQAQAAALAQAQRQQAESKALMDKQLKAAEENMNRSMQKQPNTRRLLDAAAQAGKSGVGGTMLTGPQGVDQASMQLGRATLLGQ